MSTIVKVEAKKNHKKVLKEKKREKKREKKEHKEHDKNISKKVQEKGNEKRAKSTRIRTTNPEITEAVFRSIRPGDARSPIGPKTAFQNRIGVTYTSHGVTVAAELADVALTSLAAGFVSQAIVRGLEDEFAGPAMQQLADIFKGQALNTEPVVVDLPGYLQLICMALRPRTVLHKGAAFNFTWDTTSPTIVAPQEVAYGNTNNSGYIAYGKINSSGTPGPFGLPTIETNVTYSPEQKKLAFAKFVARMSRGDNGTNKPLTTYEMRKIAYDASAFAAQTIVDGFAVGGQGGTISRLGCEASINFPVLGRFTKVRSTYRDYDRACNINVEAGGGPMELSMFAYNHRLENLRKIVKPVIKFVNANHFYHVFLLTWKYALEQYAASAEFKLLLERGVQYAEAALRDRACPVSFEECLLVLRNELMKTFAETQPGTQSLGPTTDPNESWLGYSCGVGTAPNFEVTSLYMSGPLAENLRALSATTVYDVADTAVAFRLQNIKRTRPLSEEEKVLEKNNTIIRPFIPCVGSYVDEELEISDYFVQYQDNQKISLFWPVDRAVKDKKDKKEKTPQSPSLGKKNIKIKDATIIRLNDGSIGNGLVAVNDPATITKLANNMNRNLVKNVKYIAGLCQNVCEPSANVLRQLGSNMFCVIESGDGESNSFLDTTKVISMSFGYVPEKVIVEQFKFIMAQHKTKLGRNEGSLKYCNDRETEIIRVSTEDEPVSLRAHLDAVAKLSIADGITTNIQKKLDMLSKSGDGGIFSDLAKAFNPLVTVGLGTLAQGLDMIPM